MWIVTGGCGFIGSSIIAGLNARGITDILAVDDLKSGQKFLNLADCKLLDYLDKDSFRTKINSGYSFGAINAILHQGACSDTMEYDGVFMMENNYEYSKDVLRFAFDKLCAGSIRCRGGGIDQRRTHRLREAQHVL